MSVYGSVHEHVLKSAVFSGPQRLVLSGPKGSGKTYLAQRIVSEWGSGVVLPSPDFSLPFQVVVSSIPVSLPTVRNWNFFSLPFRSKETVREVLLHLTPSQRRDYGLKYLSPVMADWAAPLAQGSVDRALRLLSAKNISHSTLTALVFAVNTGNVVEFGQIHADLTHTPSQAHALRFLLTAWVVSEIHPDSARVLDSSARHLNYPIPDLLRSLAVLESSADDLTSIYLSLWPLMVYQRGSS